MLHLDEITFFVAYKEAGFNNGSLKVTMVKGARTTASETLPDRSFLGRCGTVFRRVSPSPQVGCLSSPLRQRVPTGSSTARRVFQAQTEPVRAPNRFTCAPAHRRRGEHEAQVNR